MSKEVRCDVCDSMVNHSWSYLYRILKPVKWYQLFPRLGFQSNRYDICDDCWKDALDYIKWAMTPTDADEPSENG